MTVRSALSSRTLNRALPWIAGLVLAIGVIVFIQSRTHTGSQPETFSKKPARDVSKQPKNVPLAREARRVAVRFINTAVARKNLAAAWEISGPGIRQDLTRKEWLTGNIPVVPYPAGAVDKAPIKIDWSYPNDALLEIILLPRDGANEKPQVFFIGLKKLKNGRGRWVVDSWTPYSPPAIPAAVDN
jgi:hypothetical protein